MTNQWTCSDLLTISSCDFATFFKIKSQTCHIKSKCWKTWLNMSSKRKLLTHGSIYIYTDQMSKDKTQICPSLLYGIAIFTITTFFKAFRESRLTPLQSTKVYIRKYWLFSWHLNSTHTPTTQNEIDIVKPYHLSVKFISQFLSFITDCIKTGDLMTVWWTKFFNYRVHVNSLPRSYTVCTVWKMLIVNHRRW